MPGFSDDLLSQIRDRFAHVDSDPWQGERIFFENAGGALTLKSVVETSAEFAAIPDNQGRANAASRALVEVIERARDDVRLFFNATGGQVITGESGTELLFRLIGTAILGRGKGLVLGSTLEHPASASAAARWSEVAGMDYVQVPHDDATGTVGAEAYAPAIHPDTAVATILHTSPVTGMGVDVGAITATIRKRAPECIVIVDGIQHAAHGHIDVDAYGVDGYVISPYKVFSRHGYGVAWLSDRLAALPHNALRGGPEMNWELGTRDTGSYATMSDVVGYLDWLGGAVSDATDPRARIEAAARAIHEHEHALTRAMLHGTGNQTGLAELDGVEVLGGIDNPAREGLVSLTVRGKEAPEVVEALNARGIRTHSRKADHYSGNILNPLGLSSCVRVSMCHYNTLGEVADFLAAMREISGTAG
ncbi:aminotransferase class V-fold PLP-dependent enzyme [Brevirhabdus sp.]|uniref:aminotransferase class V-fold PLP-dependent enzyme n=1 Tax=Brevirhabdus sp. TaxID=2004514 RepID=UPI0040592200